MASSTRQQIIEAVKARLEAIDGEAPYETAVGERVYVNEYPAMGPDDPLTAIVVTIGDDIPKGTAEHVILELPMEMHAIASDRIDDCWLAVEPVLADIKRAMEQADRTLGGLVRRFMQRGITRTLPRDEGSTTVGAGITYVFPYLEAWGQP